MHPTRTRGIIMKLNHEKELVDLVQRIENEASIEALDEVLSKLNRKADMIEHLLYCDESINIFHLSEGPEFERLWNKRSVLYKKQRTIYEIAGIIYDIKSRYLINIEVAPDTNKGIRL